jgi:glycine cleavage system H protein
MNKRFTKSHEWIELEGRHGTVGITHYAQTELGDIVYAELPEVGKSVQAGEQVCTLESTKAASDVYTPVSGKITSVNEEAAKNPVLINEASESKGWLFRIELSDPKEINVLLSKTDYEHLYRS